MTAVNIPEKVQQLRAEIQASIDSFDQQITETRRRIYELTQRGTVGADEAKQNFEAALAPLIEQGRRYLAQRLEPMTRTRVTDYRDIPGLVRTTLAPNLSELFSMGGATDLNAVLTVFFEPEIRAQFESVVADRCKGDTVPPPAQRTKQLDKLLAELDTLQAQRDDLQDQLAAYIPKFEPSERTQRAAKEAQHQAFLDGLNGIREPGAEPADVFRSPEID